MQGAAVLFSLLRLLGLLPLLAASTAVAAGAAAPAAPEDLPSQGRSGFDHFVFRNGGLPSSFEELTNLIRPPEKDRTHRRGVLIPHGRSVVRFETDYKNPRMLALGKAQIAAGPADQIYVAYAEKNRSLEVISYNDGTGRFEFQVVKNFGPGLVPQVEYAHREFCLSCHQNGGPIFPHAGWMETNARPFVSQKIRAAHDPGQTHIQGIEIGKPREENNSGSADFDFGTKEANRVVSFQKSWIEGCAGRSSAAIECRRLILQNLINKIAPNASHPDDLTNLETRLRQIWPESGVQILSSVIRDRSADYMAFRPGEDPAVWSTGLLTPRTAEVTRAFSGERSAIAPPSPTDPFYMLLEADDLLSKSDVSSLLNRVNGDPEKLRQALSSKEMTSFFSGAPFSRRELFARFSKAAEQLGFDTQYADALSEAEAKMPPPRLHDSPFPISTHPQLAFLRQNCTSCHVGHGIKHLDFMEAKTDEELLATLARRKDILERIDYGHVSAEDQMPPVTSVEGKRVLSPEGQAERLAVLDRLANPKPGLPACGTLYEKLRAR